MNKVCLFSILAMMPFVAEAQELESSKNNFQKNLSEVVISGNIFPEKKKYVVQKIDVITSKQMSEMNAQSMADVLLNTGGVFVQKSQQGGGSPVVRGFEASRIQLNIDGIRYNNAIFRSGHLQNIIAVDNNMLERVEVLNGPASTIHGSDALGGVILMKTKDPILGKTRKIEITGANALVRYASVNREQTTSAGISFGNNKFASYSHLTFSQFDDLTQGRNGADSITKIWKKSYIAQRINGVDSMVKNSKPYKQVGTGYSQLDLLQKFTFAPNKHTKHSVNLQLSNSSDIPRYDRLTETDAAGVLKNAEWYYGPQVRSLAAYKFEAVKLRGFFDDFAATISHQFWKESRNNRSFGKTILNQREENVNALGYNISARKKGKAHELSVGTDAQFNFLKSTAVGTDINTGVQQNIDTRYPDGSNKMNLLGLFAQHTFKIDGGKVVINDGIRFNYNYLHSTLKDTALLFHFPITDFKQNNTALTGNIGVAYMPQNDLRLTANFSTGFRAPNFDDMTKIFESNKNQLIVPNPTLKPEYTQNYELGFQYKKGNSYLSGNAFYTSFTNAIVTDFFQYKGADSTFYNGNMTRVFASQNKAKAFIYGAGLDAKVSATEHFSMFASINYTYGRYDNDTALVPLDHIAPIFGRIGVRYAEEKWYTELYSLYNGKKKLADYNPGGEDNLVYATPQGMPSWYTVNLRVGVNVISHLNMQMGIENILDKNYRYFGSGVSAPGRNLVIAMRYQF
ncbi:MAG: TonB-dependent receptor [Chitinophagaceae bacterium]|nr:TonB-dependent receptor [Chitinophagaceae bacterium]